MKSLEPYLFFDGNCREAMEFYKKCFGGDLELMTWADAPADVPRPPETENQIMHAFLKSGNVVVMASDNPEGNTDIGDQIQLSINCESTDEASRLFKALADGGKTIQPLEKTFWAEQFGMLIDRYGIHWMVNFSTK